MLVTRKGGKETWTCDTRMAVAFVNVNSEIITYFARMRQLNPFPHGQFTPVMSELNLLSCYVAFSLYKQAE
jgi:hypothetical protein